MYEELVQRLRTHNGWALNKTLDEAADAIEVLSKMENTTRWIPVTERLPNPKDLVLVCNEFGGVHYGYFESNKQWYTANNWLADAWTVMPNVTHWMPLPEPPKEGE